MPMVVPYLDLSFSNLQLKGEILEAVSAVIDSGNTILGPYVKEFEDAWSAYTSCTYSIGVGNGLDAMIIGLKSLGIGPGDEVIVPSNTYIATWLAISSVGATIVPVEPNMDTFNIDETKIKEAITARTKLILVVHLYGRPCKMSTIMDIASEFGLFVMEDNAQAQGALSDLGKTAGIGHINATSFYPGKNFGAFGDAGMITTNDYALFQRCLELRNYGSSVKYIHKIKGLNSRLDEVQAAILLKKFKYLDGWYAERKYISLKFRALLADQVFIPEWDDGSVWHIFPVLIKDRDTVRNTLNKEGIGCLIHYPIPPHLQEAYAELNLQKGDFPLAEKIALEELSLPIYPGLTDDQIHLVCEKLLRAVKRH